MLTDFINNLKVVAVQVIILYLISGIGFIADKTKIFVQADGKRLRQFRGEQKYRRFCRLQLSIRFCQWSAHPNI